jgi:mRNA degradation ribonuclease J1/J2
MATLVLDKTNRLIHPIQLTLWGLIQHEDEHQDLEASINRTIRSVLSTRSKDLYESLKTAIRRIVNERLEKKPLIEVHIVKLNNSPSPQTDNQ